MSFLRGWIGEKKATFHLWLSLDTKTYRRFHNIIVPSSNGTAQIDHLLVSPYGVFLVETKNKKGWIFGSEKQSKWTQVIYNARYTFQNPLRQTFRQKKVLAEFLEIDDSVIHTIIYFVGDCNFKTPLPPNVLRSGVGRYIKTFKAEIIDPSELKRLTTFLKQHKSRSTLTKRDHIAYLRQRHSSDTFCPKCGSKLVVRTARQGPSTGSRFLGCESYPVCRYTRSL